MSNPFMNNNIFPNLQSKPDLLLGNKSQTNPLSNNLNNGLKNETNNPIFNQNNNPNPFKINFEPNSNNLNNQNDNNKNMTNLFPPLKTQQNNIQNSSTNININQNSNNNIINNSNPINNNNNTNTNTSNIFNTAQFTNKPPDSNNNNNSKQDILNIIPKINPLEIKKEEKKEEPNIFISQSNNILNKSNEVPEKSQINNQLKISDLPSFNPLQEKKQKSKVSEFINNLLSEDKIIFSEKEKEEYEKNQLSFKKNEEILDEFKNMLDNHKEKYTKSVSNMRLFDKKFISLINNIKINAAESLNNEMKYKKLMEKIKITETKFTNLKINMTNKDKTITDALDYLKKKMNNYNNLTTIKTQNFEENNKFYKDLNETSEKIKKIDNNINIIWNSLNRKEENKNELFDISDEKQRENYINNINNKDNYKLHRINNNIILNNKMDGIILERNELDKIKKIYVEQKDLNNIFTECYDGLYGLKSIQDEFDIKYERLKNSLIKKIDERNVNFSKRSNDTKEEDLDIEYNN